MEGNLFSLIVSILSRPEVWMYTLFGTVGGILVGCIPGLTAAMGVAVLLPFTFHLEPLVGLAMLSGIYVGGTYGGSISAILLRIPGTPAAAFTTLDGYPMATRGEAGRAIGIATTSSFIGGLISIIFLIITSDIIVKFTLKFGPAEYFAIAIWGLCSVATVTGRKLVFGLISVVMGIFLGTIGMDPMTGALRFTFGLVNLQSGIEFVPIMIGLFGISEVLKEVGNTEIFHKIEQKIGKILPSKEDIKSIWRTWIRGAAIGIGVGVLPGNTGAGMSGLIAYNTEKSVSKHPEKFGTGTPEGIAAAETANNASVGGALVPLLTLGIPGDAITALLIGAFMMHNIRPGALLFQQNPGLIYGIFVALILAHFFFLFLGLWASGLFAKVLNIPRHILMALVVMFCTLGAYAISNSLFNIVIMVVFGVVGYLMERIDMPITPMLIGFILGPMAEGNLRVALKMYEGNIFEIITRPYSLVFYLLAAAIIIFPKIRGMRRNK
ncbi:MAG: hypothetical protein VR72_13070 [Clostridiaceae bacterium BRH_c20a]|nr:MAG: hypothetical protein VR72_13070 [Clostridiaceae bacterium BRH_c20a]